MEKLLEAINRVGPSLANETEHCESIRRLSATAFSSVKSTGLYKLLLPSSLGGFEADPATAARLIEALAGHSAAAAWSVMVANASIFWSKCLPAEGLTEIFDQGDERFFAGSFNPPLMAEQANGGFKVRGRIKLCSNVHEAAWIGGLGMMTDGGKPAMENGMPVMRLMVMEAGDCTVEDNWHAMGMKATDSSDVTVENVYVPLHRSYLLSTFDIRNDHFSGALYSFPVVGINGCCLIAPIALAIARNALNEMKLLTDKKPMGSIVPLKEKGSYLQKLGMAEAALGSAKAWLYGSLEGCWNKLKAGGTIDLETKAALLLAGVNTVQSCVKVVDLAYGAAGTSAIYTNNSISRYFTDIQVIRQHGFACENRYETAAQMLLGIQPDFAPAVL